MEKILTTLNPYLKGGPTHWPTLEWYLNQPIDLSPEIKTVLSNLKQVEKNVKRNEEVWKTKTI